MNTQLDMLFHPANWTTLQLFEFFGLKALLAVFCGGVVGLERELKGKVAGIKTNVLICLGSTILTAASVLISLEHASRGYVGDPARIAAQIIPGIGFLGGGAIIQARGTVLGLTTAATIWCVAAIGVLLGMGYHDLGAALSIFTITILISVSFFEDKVIGRSVTFATELLIDDHDGEVRQAVNELLSQYDLRLESFEVSPRGNLSHIHMKYSGHRRDQKRFNLALWGARGVKEVKHH